MRRSNEIAAYLLRAAGGTKKSGRRSNVDFFVDLEDAFRSMKSDLGFRPIYHQKEHRCDGHLFISVLAYHVLHSIRLQLRNQGITSNWSTIRSILSTHFRVTTSMNRSDGKMLFVRKTAKPEDCHIKIYDALGLPHRPGKLQKTIL